MDLAGRKRRREQISGENLKKRIDKKLVGLFLIVILALVGLAVRITLINANDGEEYSRIVLSQAQQQYESRTIPFKRGDILDRNGTILATSEKVYNVILDCKVVNSVTEDEDGNEVQPYVEPTVRALVDRLGIDEIDIRERLEAEETKDSQYQVLATGLSISEKEAFEAYLAEAEEEDPKEDSATADQAEEKVQLSEEEILERQNVKGIWFEEDYERVYPLGSLACDLIGFTYDGESADWGLEGYYSSVLNGTNGRQFGYFNTDADVEQTLIDPVDGENVVSTIDANIQQIIRENLEKHYAMYENGPNGKEGAANMAVIAMDPNTGEILGMDSTGWYDLNNPRDLTAFYDATEIAAMDEQEQVEALNAIWRNYCISDAYEPGSTVKPMTVAGAMETGSLTWDDTFYCDGFEEVANQIIRCVAWPDEHGELTVAGALVYSCNDALMQIAAKEGKEDFIRYQEIFNFGMKTGIDLPGENSGITYSLDSMGDAELATSSFGQGFTCTMIQEAAAFSSLVNGGIYYKPHVVSAVTDSNGDVVETMGSTVEHRTVSEDISDNMRNALTAVIDYGSGTEAKVAGYSMGGKSGTAEKLPRDEGNYLVSFIGYAPADAPQIVLYVIVDEPNVEDQSTSVYAQYLWKDIMAELLPYMNIFPDEIVESSGDWEYTDEDADEASSEEEAAEETAEETEAGEETVEQAAESGENPAFDGVAEEAADGSVAVVPPEQAVDETVENGGNNVDSEGIQNSEWNGE